MTPRTFRSTLAGLALSTLAGAAWAQPTITALNNGVLARSGRVSIQGTGFGTTRGEVLVAGIPAWVSTWLDTRIVAYVPEEAPLGPTSVIVDAGGQQSNAVPLEVTTRQADGRIRWIFEIDSEFIYYRPAEAPDGTLYVHAFTIEGGGGGRVFAISPDGALLWITEVIGPAYVPPIAGPDGAVYVGSNSYLTRISPSGEIDWTFEGSAGIAASAAVGPDGTVYTAFETGTTGAVALDPATGALLWSNNENTMLCIGCSNELRLGPSTPGGPNDRMYVYWESLWAFSLDGDFLWQGFSDLDPHEPGIGSDGVLYAPHGDDLVAYSPFDGSWLWSNDGPWNAGISDVEVGPDDTLYFVSDGRWIDAFDPHAQTSLWRHDMFDWLRRPAVSPDGQFLLAGGGGSCSSEQGCVIPFVEAFETQNGEELWHLDLNEIWDPDFRSVTWDHARMSADSRRAYFTGFILGAHDAGDERSLLWAIDLVETGIFSDGFESGDTSAWSDTVP